MVGCLPCASQSSFPQPHEPSGFISCRGKTLYPSSIHCLLLISSPYFLSLCVEATSAPLVFSCSSYWRCSGTVSPHLYIECGHISKAAANFLISPKYAIASFVFICLTPLLINLLSS